MAEQNTDQQPETTPASRPQIQIDDSKVIANYANFCRVTGTPEELIIDFGRNPQPFGVPTEPIPVTQRIGHQLLHRQADAARLAVEIGVQTGPGARGNRR